VNETAAGTGPGEDDSTGDRPTAGGEPAPGGAALATDSRVARMVQRLSASPTFARFAPKVVPPMDRALMRLTGGRASFSGLAVPTLVLTTTGHRSGQAREAPLATFPQADGSFLVVGSNFGRQHHPAWTANLLHDPSATVAFRGSTFAVRGRLLEGDERDQAWARLRVVWPAYDAYAERVDRELRIFRLERVA
jgi:deazaflavin-dependent oxidoreductase (nitroreductase family)